MTETENTTRAADPLYRTIDGHAVVPGLRVWNYDLDLSQVAPFYDGVTGPGGEFWAGWFEMTDPATGGRMSSMNGSRMWVRHPADGRDARTTAEPPGTAEPYCRDCGMWAMHATHDMVYRPTTERN